MSIFEPRRYAVVSTSTGGKKHIAWWWEPDEHARHQSWCQCRPGPHWVSLCSMREGLEEADGTADCKMCLKAIAREFEHIDFGIGDAEHDRDRAIKELKAHKASARQLGRCVSIATEVEMDEAS